MTRSGIVSSGRFDEFIRTSAPVVDFAVENLSKNSAVLRARAESAGVDSADCSLNVVVLDTHGMIVFDRTLAFEQLAPIAMTGLRPFHKYTMNAQVDQRLVGAVPMRLLADRLRQGKRRAPLQPEDAHNAAAGLRDSAGSAGPGGQSDGGGAEPVFW